MSVKRDKQRYYKMKCFAVVCIYILNMYICDDYQQKPFLLIVNHFITFKEGINLHSECLITLNVVSENFHIYYMYKYWYIMYYGHFKTRDKEMIL